MPAGTMTTNFDRRLVLAPAIGLLTIAGIFFGVRIWHGIWFLPFVDESEHLLGGMMLNHGAVMYRSFIDAHGPVTFMLAQAYGALFGWAQPNDARLITVGLALCACGCIAASSAVPGRLAKLWAAALFCGLIASVWLLQALYMVNYHAFAGCFVAMALALFVVPAWHQANTTKRRAFVAGCCCALVIATAYSFGPAMVLLGASAMWATWQSATRNRIAWFAAGGGAAFLIVLGWLLLFGDVIGYITFHFIDNQLYYAPYAPVTFAHFLEGMEPSWQPVRLVHSLGLVSFLAAAIMSLASPFMRSTETWRGAGPVLLGLAGLVALCARGGWFFQDGSFLIASFALLALELPAALSRIPVPGRAARLGQAIGGSAVVGLVIAAAELAMRHALDSPWNMTRQEMVAQPIYALAVSQAPLYVKIRALTGPEDRILVVPYAPDIFLLAGRMPMDKYSLYLPWNADYAKAPWFGRDRDLCVDMAKAPPKLVYFNNWIVWYRYGMADYAPCFTAILAKDYVRQTDFPDLYLRRDQLAAGRAP